MRLRLHPDGMDGWNIEDVSIAYGGMAPVTKLARRMMAYMIGKAFGMETFVGARKVLVEEFHMPDDVPGGQAQYRMTLAARWVFACGLVFIPAHRFNILYRILCNISLLPASCTSFICIASVNLEKTLGLM